LIRPTSKKRKPCSTSCAGDIHCNSRIVRFEAAQPIDGEVRSIPQWRSSAPPRPDTDGARGLPGAIRSDNGVPFASPNALFNLSRMAVWWLRLGIAIERIRPGHPHENGRHERMHLTLKTEATRPPGMNSLQQQARFDAFVAEFNTERPHEALAMKCPAQLYTPSPRPYTGLPDLAYPLHDRDVLVTSCGRICLHRKKINVSTVFAGQRLGIKEVDDGIWIVSFMRYDLGFIDLETKDPATPRQPVRPGVVTHVLGTSR
jgi:hypothetical protein